LAESAKIAPETEVGTSQFQPLSLERFWHFFGNVFLGQTTPVLLSCPFLNGHARLNVCLGKIDRFFKILPNHKKTGKIFKKRAKNGDFPQTPLFTSIYLYSHITL